MEERGAGEALLFSSRQKKSSLRDFSHRETFQNFNLVDEAIFAFILKRKSLNTVLISQHSWSNNRCLTMLAMQHRIRIYVIDSYPTPPLIDKKLHSLRIPKYFSKGGG